MGLTDRLGTVHWSSGIATRTAALEVQSEVLTLGSAVEASEGVAFVTQAAMTVMAATAAMPVMAAHPIRRN